MNTTEQNVRRLKKLGGRALATAAMAIAIGISPAGWADPIVVDPSAPNTGNASGGAFSLDGSVGSFSTTGGTGIAYQAVEVACSSASACGTNKAFGGDFVVNITGFNNGASTVSGTNIGSTWQLFAVIHVSGTGDWTGTTTQQFTANSAAVTLQIYGVQGGSTFSFNDPNYSVNPPFTSTSIVSGSSLSRNDLTANGSEFQVTGIASTGGNGATNACWDDNGTATPTTSNCILLADGTSTTGTSFQVTGTAPFGDSETFSLVAALTPESYANGPTGFFDPLPTFALTIDSGTPIDEIDVVDVTGTLAKKQYVTCVTSDASGQDLDCGNPVHWDVSGPASSVPEPGSLAILGMALMAVGALAQRRRFRGRSPE